MKHYRAAGYRVGAIVLGIAALLIVLVPSAMGDFAPAWRALGNSFFFASYVMLLLAIDTQARHPKDHMVDYSTRELQEELRRRERKPRIGGGT